MIQNVLKRYPFWLTSHKVDAGRWRRRRHIEQRFILCAEDWDIVDLAPRQLTAYLVVPGNCLQVRRPAAAQARAEHRPSIIDTVAGATRRGAIRILSPRLQRACSIKCKPEWLELPDQPREETVINFY